MKFKSGEFVLIVSGVFEGKRGVVTRAWYNRQYDVYLWGQDVRVFDEHELGVDDNTSPVMVFRNPPNLTPSTGALYATA